MADPRAARTRRWARRSALHLTGAVAIVAAASLVIVVVPWPGEAGLLSGAWVPSPNVTTSALPAGLVEPAEPVTLVPPPEPAAPVLRTVPEPAAPASPPLPPTSPPVPPPSPSPRPRPLEPAPISSGGVPRVFDADFPDPFVLRVGDTYFGYATSGPLGFVQVARSSDLVSWTPVGNGLSLPAQWAPESAAWAPAVVQRGSAYVMYYAAKVAGTAMWCISYAVSPLPEGPFVDSTVEPFLCQRDHGGSIDPYVFIDRDGAAYLLWQSQGIVQGEPTMLWSAPLSADGRALDGPAHRLLHTAQAWEGNVIENPAMVQTDAGYFLFYSANEWVSDSYATGVARCDGPLGPCTRVYSSPVLASRDAVLGPGGASPVMAPDGSLHLAFHAWTAPQVSYEAGGARTLHLAAVGFSDVGPTVG